MLRLTLLLERQAGSRLQAHPHQKGKLPSQAFSHCVCEKHWRLILEQQNYYLFLLFPMHIFHDESVMPVLQVKTLA